MEDLEIQRDFLVCVKMRGGGGPGDVDAGFLLLPEREKLVDSVPPKGELGLEAFDTVGEAKKSG